MKNTFIVSLIVVLLIKGVLLFATISNKNMEESSYNFMTLNMFPDSSIPHMKLNHYSTLTTEEKQGLSIRKHKIKMAIDLNLKFNKKWRKDIFRDAIDINFDHKESLIIFFINNNIVFPNHEYKIGEFDNEDIEIQYNYLLEMGMYNFENALLVDYYIEKNTIDFLTYQLKEVVKNEELASTYQKQLEASNKHLEKIISLIESNGFSTSLENVEIFFTEFDEWIKDFRIELPNQENTL